MHHMAEKENVDHQYSNDEKLMIRLNFQKKYRTNPKSYQEWLWERYPLTEECKVLELGCGTGAIWENRIEQLPNDAKLLLSDYSEGMLDIVKSKFSTHPNVEYQVIDIQSIPIEENTFDIVIANSMLYHVADIPKALSEVHRVLKAGGTFIVATTGNRNAYTYFNEKLTELDSMLKVYDEYDLAFSLQNGTSFLEPIFRTVEMQQYDNSLKVSSIEDFIEYIRSVVSEEKFSANEFEAIFDCFEKIRLTEGTLNIPVDAGVFIARK